MKNLRKHVRKHARAVAKAARHVRKTLRSPIHPYIGWWAIGISAVWCSLMIGAAFAQVVDNQQQLQLEAFSSTTPLWNLARGNAGLLPLFASGTPDTSLCRAGNSATAASSPCRPPLRWPVNANSSSTPSIFGNFNPTGQLPAKHGQQTISAQQLRGLKKNLGKFALDLSRAKTEILFLQKKGIAIPDSVHQALNTLSQGLQQLRTSSTATAPGILQNLQSASQTLSQQLPQLGLQVQLPALLKQAQSQLDQASKQLAQDQNKSQTAGLDLSGPLSDFQTAIGQLQDTLNQASQTASTDPQSTLNNLRTNFFGQLDNLRSKNITIPILLNPTPGIPEMAKLLSAMQQQIARLKSKSIDTSAADSLLAAAQGQLAQLRTLASTTPPEMVQLAPAVEQFMQSQQALADQLQQLTGDNGFMSLLALVLRGNQKFQFSPPPGFSASSTQE